MTENPNSTNPSDNTSIDNDFEEMDGRKIQFDAIEIEFKQTNAQWALDNLPVVRFSIALLGKSRDELKANIKRSIDEDDDEAGDAWLAFIEDTQIVAERFKAGAEVCEMAMARMIAVSDAIVREDGYYELSREIEK